MKAFKVKRRSETYYRVELPQRVCPDGKRHSVMGKTRAEAIQKAEQEFARWERGLDRNAKNKTLAQYLSEFLAYYKRDGGVAPSTYQDYHYHIESHIVPLLGTVTLADLDPRRVDAFTHALTRKACTPNLAVFLFGVAKGPAIRGGLEVHPRQPGVVPHARRQAPPGERALEDPFPHSYRIAHVPEGRPWRPLRGPLCPSSPW